MITMVNLNNDVTNQCNIGDKMCSPSLYFDFGDFKLEDYSTYIPSKDDVCIIGGGGLFSTWHQGLIDRYLVCKKKIVWGVGVNTHGETEYILDDILYKFDLVGLRDDVEFHDFNFVPCVSCMHPAFDREYKIQNDVVVYEHLNHKIPINLHKRNNSGDDIEEKLEFLGSSNCIVTNTYHGMYWGILLKKLVVVYKPFSNRFLYTPFEVRICDEFNYMYKLKTANTYDLLQTYRRLNEEFYVSVSNVLI